MPPLSLACPRRGALDVVDRNARAARRSAHNKKPSGLGHQTGRLATQRP
jgi:hypothetical protein